MYPNNYLRVSTALYLKGETGAETTKTYFFSLMIPDRYKQDDNALNLFN